MNTRIRNVSLSYLIGTAGLLLVALGVAISIKSNLGTSPLSSPAYVMEGVWGLSVGNWTIIVNMTYMLVQLLVLRSRFKLKYLMQIPASIVFGYLIDFCLWMCSFLTPQSILVRVLLSLLACAVTALGVSIEVMARAWMLSAEMTVAAFVKTTGRPFGHVKVAMDTLMVLISALLALLLYGNPFGTGEFTGFLPLVLGRMPGVVIGLGTILLAFLAGGLMRFTDPLVNRMMDRLFNKIVYGE